MLDAINYDEIGITDDVMFGSVFRDVEDCKELLQRILGIEIARIELVEEQKSFKVNYSGKGIRIDVYVKDVDGNAYDIEMQLTDTGELDLRSRYYHSEMDSYQIKKGKKYKFLKQSIVIFVCGFDMFGENRSIYTFESICTDNHEIRLMDKRKTIFVNIYGDREGLKEDTVNLLEYLRTGEPTDTYTRSLDEKVIEIRNDNEWRENYMTFEMKLDQRYEEGQKAGIELGRTEGIELGRSEGIELVAANMLQENHSVEEIQKCTGLPVERIIELAEVR